MSAALPSASILQPIEHPFLAFLRLCFTGEDLVKAANLLEQDLSILRGAKVFVCTASFDALRDEGVALAKKLREAVYSGEDLQTPCSAPPRWEHVMSTSPSSAKGKKKSVCQCLVGLEDEDESLRKLSLELCNSVMEMEPGKKAVSARQKNAVCSLPLWGRQGQMDAFGHGAARIDRGHRFCWEL
eukprot:g33132.t1